METYAQREKRLKRADNSSAIATGLMFAVLLLAVLLS